MTRWSCSSGHWKVIQGWLCQMQHWGTTVTSHHNVQWLYSCQNWGRRNSRNSTGSLVFFESTKTKRIILSTTVAELYALMKCYGTCQMLRGLIKDITGHMRIDANNLVTIASTTHVPEQQETLHMMQMLRKEACPGSIAELSHIRTHWCFADCLTKKSANPQALIDAVRQGILKEVDAHPPLRTLVEHKAYLRSWLPTLAIMWILHLMCFSLRSIFTDKCVQRICCMFLLFHVCVMKVALFAWIFMLKDLFICFCDFVPAAQLVSIRSHSLCCQCS